MTTMIYLPVFFQACSILMRAPRFSECHGLDLLHGHGCPSHVHVAAAAILILLALPDEFGLHLRERMGIVGTPADGLRHGRGPPGGDSRSWKRKRTV